MIVNHLSFSVAAAKQSAFDEWFPPLVQRTLSHSGCVGYDHLVDPNDPHHHFLIEVWASPEALEAHAKTAEHAEITRDGTALFGMHDLVLRRWADAGGFTITERPRTTRD